MSQREDDHHVISFPVLIERDIAGPATRDNQLAQVLFSRAADLRVAFQDLKRVDNQVEDLGRGDQIFRREKFNQPLEVRPGAFPEYYLRQRLRRGRRAGLPAMRAA